MDCVSLFGRIYDASPPPGRSSLFMCQTRRLRRRFKSCNGFNHYQKLDVEALEADAEIYVQADTLTKRYSALFSNDDLVNI